MILNVDILLTVLEPTGLEGRVGLPGASVSPLIAGRDVACRDDVFTEHLWDHSAILKTAAVRTERFKRHCDEWIRRLSAAGKGPER